MNEQQLTDLIIELEKGQSVGSGLQTVVNIGLAILTVVVTLASPPAGYAIAVGLGGAAGAGLIGYEAGELEDLINNLKATRNYLQTSTYYSLAKVEIVQWFDDSDPNAWLVKDVIIRGFYR